MLKKGNMPSVHVIDVLTSKVCGTHNKDATHEDGDRSRGEDAENEEVLNDEENAEDDPMVMLAACAPNLELETPKTKKTRNESRNAHWCGKSTCPSDRFALEVQQVA